MDQTMDKTTDQTMDQTMDTNMDETLAALDKDVKPPWPMPYFANRFLVPSKSLPTYAGFHRNLGHRNGQFHGGWTLRFADLKYYVMVLCIRTKGVLPIDKQGCLMLRCPHKNKRCKARTLLAANHANQSVCNA